MYNNNEIYQTRDVNPMTSTRSTVQKRIVEDAAVSMFHPTADEVYSSITVAYPTISRATVYRILNGLVECGKLKRVKIPDGADRFDKTVTEHQHFRCICCNSVSDISVSPVFNMPKGYKLTDYSIILEGICPSCSDKQ